MPAFDKGAQTFHHALILLADGRAAKGLQKLISTLFFQGSAENSGENLVAGGLRPRTFEQIEFAPGQSQLVLESAHHLRKKAVHGAECQLRQGADYAFQRFCKVGMAQLQIVSQLVCHGRIVCGLGQLSENRVCKLSSCLAREGQRHDFFGLHASRHQLDDAVGKLERFS